jgi:hypothetical protein
MFEGYNLRRSISSERRTFGLNSISRFVDDCFISAITGGREIVLCPTAD